jgi:hypothetical protein
VCADDTCRIISIPAIDLLDYLEDNIRWRGIYPSTTRFVERYTKCRWICGRIPRNRAPMSRESWSGRSGQRTLEQELCGLGAWYGIVDVGSAGHGRVRMTARRIAECLSLNLWASRGLATAEDVISTIFYMSAHGFVVDGNLAIGDYRP